MIDVILIACWKHNKHKYVYICIYIAILNIINDYLGFQIIYTIYKYVQYKICLYVFYLCNCKWLKITAILNYINLFVVCGSEAKLF